MSLGGDGGLFASDVMENEDDDDELDEDEFGGLGVISEAARAAVKRSRKKTNEGGVRGSLVYFHR